MKKKCLTALVTMALVLMPLSAYSLGDLEESMRLNNNDLLMKEQGVRQAELDVKSAKANYSPNISAMMSGTYMVNPPIGKITVDADDIIDAVAPGMPSTGEYITVYDGMPNTMYQASLNLMQPIFTWGKISGAVDLSKQMLQIKRIDKANKFDLLSVELEGLIGSLSYMDDMLSLLDEADSVSTDLVALAESGVENGVMLPIDLLDAEVKQNELSVRRLQLSQQFDDILDKVGSLTGIEDLTRDMIEYTPREDDWNGILLADRLSLREKSMSGSNKAVAMADGMVGISETAEDISKSMFYGKPDLALNVGLSYGGSLFPLIEKNWTREDDYGLNITLAMKTTLWDGGKIKNNIDKARSQKVTAELGADTARDMMGTQFDSAWRKADLAKAQLDYGLELDGLYEKQLEIMRIKQEAGAGGEADILQKELERIENRVEMDLHRIDLMTNALTIEYLAGLR